jgi:hypothetical protein
MTNRHRREIKREGLGVEKKLPYVSRERERHREIEAFE